ETDKPAHLYAVATGSRGSSFGRSSFSRCGFRRRAFLGRGGRRRRGAATGAHQHAGDYQHRQQHQDRLTHSSNSPFGNETRKGYLPQYYMNPNRRPAQAVTPGSRTIGGSPIPREADATAATLPHAILRAT